MYIKRYTIAVAMLMGIVGWYVHTYLTKETMAIDFFGHQLPEIAIFLWVLVPLIVLYIASVFHMSFYSFLNTLKFRKYEKDSQKMIDTMIDAYLGREDREHKFTTQRYKLLGTLIDNTTLLPFSSLSKKIQNSKLNEIINLIEDIKEGKTVDLTPYSLSLNNDLVLQNNRNQYENKEIIAEEILSNSSQYEYDLCTKAYEDYVKTSSLELIEKYQKYMDKIALFQILNRVNSEENPLDISNENIISLLNNLELTQRDYIDISISLSTRMIPEDRISLFETLSEKNDTLMKAYLFTLFDLEMIDLATEILNNSQPDEYLKFKAYNALKKSDTNFNINLFI